MKEQCDAMKVSCELVYNGLKGVKYPLIYDFFTRSPEAKRETTRDEEARREEIIQRLVAP